MTDLSNTLDLILQKHNARLQQHRLSIEDITDEFLKDAYQIQSHIFSLHTFLRSIRAPYLSTTQPSRTKRQSASILTSFSHPHPHAQQQYLTNAQRDQIDAESKSTLRDLAGGIARLSDTETQRKEIRRQILLKRHASRFPLGALGRWAAGTNATQPKPALTAEEEEEEAREKTKDAWRESVVWFLRMRLGLVMDLQRDMMERRVMREVERSKSVLYKTKGSSGGTAAAASADGVDLIAVADPGRSRTSTMISEKGRRTAMADDRQNFEAGTGAEQSLTPEQLQLFAQENNAMLKYYEDTLDQVRAAERSMIEISELQTTLAQNLEIQSERIDQLVEDAGTTEDNVTGGNKQLRQATERWRPAKWFFWVSCGLSGFLVLWDLAV